MLGIKLTINPVEIDVMIVLNFIPQVVNTLLINSVSTAEKPSFGNVLITRIISVDVYKVLAKFIIINGIE
jgi:hypothetical protein